MILLQDWIGSSSLSQLVIVLKSVFIAIVVQIESLAAGVETSDGLLGLQIFELYAGVFIGSRIQSVLVRDAVECPIGFGQLASPGLN